MNISPIEVQKYLKGVEYPATKNDLVNAAQHNDASQEVFSVLEEMDDKEYNSPADVSEQIGDIM